MRKHPAAANSLALFLFLTTAALSQTKLTQDFEAALFPPVSWTVQFSGILYWERATPGGYGTSGFSTVFRFYEASGFEVQSLQTPTFAASVAGDSLHFDYAYATYLNEVDSLIIETSADGGSNFSRLRALAGGSTVGAGMVTAPPAFTSFAPTPTQWASKSYALPVATNTLRFTAKSAYGNNLYLDNITVRRSLANDVGVAGILTPRYFINLPFTETPRATVANFGLNDQSFSIEMVITGPGGFSYSSTKSVSLAAGLSQELTFDPPFNPSQAGTYTAQCTTLLGTDEDAANNMSQTTVAAENYNYGTNGGVGNQLYYFSNSLPGTGAPAQPPFNWRDTTGSRDLIANGVALAPITGNVDDGYFTLTGLFAGKSFRLFGIEYRDSVFVSTNGIVSFTQGSDDFLPSALPSSSTPNAAIYPLWMDYDFSDPNVAFNKLSYKIDGDILIITYTRVPRYNPDAVSDDYVTFQVCLRFAEAHTSNSFAAVQFDATQTGTSFLSAYQAHSVAHLIGAEDESGSSAVTYRFVTAGAPVVPGPAFGSSLCVTLGPAYESSVRANIKGFLEGAYSSTSHGMRTDIFNLIPLTQPYNASPWNYAGEEKLTSVPANVVDWILVELRTSAANSTRSARRSALLLSNGSVVELDGASPLGIDLIPAGSYYVVLSHRNHLPIMSSGGLPLTSAPSSLDFTTGQGQAYGTLPMNQLESGVFGLVAGDANNTSIISASDANAVFGALNSTAYSQGDVNMTGIVTAADANVVFGNLNRSSQVPGAAPQTVRDKPTEKLSHERMNVK